MAETAYDELKAHPLYARHAARAKAGRPPSRATPIGVMAATRVADAASRGEMAAAIRAEDALVAGDFGTVHYQPAAVCGIELRLEPLQPSIGTAIHGLDVAAHMDLANPAANAELAAFLRGLWLRRRVLVFRGQAHLSRQQMVQFASHFGEVGERFGEPDHMPNSSDDLFQQVDVPGIPNMLVLPADEAVPAVSGGWHADSTWLKRPPMATMLMCREAPPIGGDTCFCDCYAMWQGLSQETRERVANLAAVHVGDFGHKFDGKAPMAVHPVARTHPETGRTTLYVQQGFVRALAGNHLSSEEARALLLEMKLQEGRPEYTCRVRWAPGSIALWDNRAVLHCASADFWPHRRVMERLTILDAEESRRTPYYAPAAGE